MTQEELKELKLKFITQWVPMYVYSNEKMLSECLSDLTTLLNAAKHGEWVSETPELFEKHLKAEKVYVNELTDKQINDWSIESYPNYETNQEQFYYVNCLRAGAKWARKQILPAPPDEETNKTK